MSDLSMFRDQAQKGFDKGLRGLALYQHVFGQACMLLGDPDNVDSDAMRKEARRWIRVFAGQSHLDRVDRETAAIQAQKA